MMSMQITGRVGMVNAATGANDEPFAQGRFGEALVSDFMPRYAQAVLSGMVYTLTLTATSSGVAAGNIVSAAAAASTQFALINPATSGKNLVLVTFGLGVVSGTPGAGPVFHGYIPGASSITAASPGGTIRSNVLGSTGSVAIPWALAAGSAITGGQAPVTHSLADFTSTNTAAASVSEVRAIEYLDGRLVIPPGIAWLPLWSAAGTSLLNGYHVSWIEVPV